MHRGGRRGHAVHQPAGCIHPHAGFHAEMPLIAFAGAAHLLIAFPSRVLGAAVGGNQRRVHDRAGLHRQSILPNMRIELRKDHFRKSILLKHMPEVQDHHLVRNIFPH